MKIQIASFTFPVIPQGGPQTAMTEVIDSRVPFTLLLQTASQNKVCLSVPECDRKLWRFKYLHYPKMISNEQSTPKGSHKLFVGKGRETEYVHAAHCASLFQPVPRYEYCLLSYVYFQDFVKHTAYNWYSCEEKITT